MRQIFSGSSFTLGALALSAVSGIGSTHAVIARSVPTIAESFAAFWTAARDKPFEEQEALWERLIEQPREDLYASVVWEVRDNPDWQGQREQQLRSRFADYPRTSGEIASTAQALTAQIPLQAARFRGLFPDAATHPSVQLVLAPNFDAKSGVLADGTAVLAFSVDTLVLEHADMRVLFPHELFHLYQATYAGIQNDGVMPGADLTLPLFAEGLATYVSSVLAPGHSDAQLLLQKNLGALSAEKLPQAAARFLTDVTDKNPNLLQSPAYARWFEAAKTNYQSDLPNRAGYWLGLNLIRQLRHKHSLRELASWSPSRAQNETRVALLEMAANNDTGAQAH
jgi:hypothetical protein